MKNITKYLILAGMAILIVACKKEETTPEAIVEPVASTSPTDNMLKLGETYILGANAKAVLYSPKALVTGYNEVYAALYDSTDGTKLLNGHFDIMPMMDMGTMQHSCPVENTEDTLASNGLFKSAVVFSMPGTSTQWSLDLSFHNHKNEKHGEGSLGVNIAASSPIRIKNVVLALDSNAKVLISMFQTSTAKVGINDIEFTLHKNMNNISFPAIEDYTMEIEPTMPSMGHGSPNNVNPVHSGMGHYKGKVNFTMTGLWNVKVKLYKNGILLSSDQYFEITL